MFLKKSSCSYSQKSSFLTFWAGPVKSTAPVEVMH